MAVTVDSKVRDIIKDKEAVKIIEEYLDGFSTNPQLKMGYGMTLRAMCKFPQTGISEDKFKEMEERLNELAGQQ